MTQLCRDFFWVILLPLSWLCSAIVKLNLRARKKTPLNVPILSVGNLHLGGTGKTPLVIQIARQLETKNPAIVSRGYRSRLSKTGAKLDKKSIAGPKDFGDEPWEMSLSTSSDVYVGADRLKLARHFDIAKHHGLILLDDGFQHVQIARDLDLLVVPGEENPWESACFPLGNLREGLSSLKRASLVVITCLDAKSFWVEDWKSIISEFAPGIAQFVGLRKLRSVTNAQGKKIEADSHRFGVFCGIGRPQRFLQDMQGWTTTHYSKTYPDHYQYSKEDVQELLNKATELSVGAFVTTEKDFPKVATFFAESGFPLFRAQMGYELESGFWETLNRRLEKV